MPKTGFTTMSVDRQEVQPYGDSSANFRACLRLRFPESRGRAWKRLLTVSSLPRRCNGEGQHQLCQAVLISSVSVGDIRFGFLELGLSKFHNRGEADIVT